MNKILAVLLIAAALSSTGALAEDKFQVPMENSNEKCFLIDDGIDCSAMRK